MIRSGLLFRSGDRVSVPRIEETERVLRAARYLYDVQIRPVAYRDGVVDIEVRTHDTWTLDIGATASRTGGSNAGSLSLTERNLLGTGTSLSIGRSTSVDRTGTQVAVSHDRAFGTWTSVGYAHTKNSDGDRQEARLVRPFYSLDARWAAGITLRRDDRIDPVYNAGNIIGEYRHLEERAEVFAGWSTGRVDGWVHRWSAGVTLQQDEFALAPGLVPPRVLPQDETLTGPFLRFETIEDRYLKSENLNLIGRAEYLQLGTSARVQVGRSLESLGSTRESWLYSATVSHGFEWGQRHTLLTLAGVSGQYSEGQVRRQTASTQLRYFHPQSSHWLLYASLSADVLTNPATQDTLLLGGDNGLRGYPLRYQAGQQRVLLTVEQRLFTDQYWLRLFRVGAAAFFDTGRAWGGDNVNTVNPGWLSNVGVGLRIFNVRTALNSALHLDIAFPLNPDPSMKKVQFLVSTKASF